MKYRVYFIIAFLTFQSPLSSFLLVCYTYKNHKNRKHIIPDFRNMMCFLLYKAIGTGPKAGPDIFA